MAMEARVSVTVVMTSVEPCVCSAPLTPELCVWNVLVESFITRNTPVGGESEAVGRPPSAHPRLPIPNTLRKLTARYERTPR